MKKFILLSAMLLIGATVAQSQLISYQTNTVFNNKAYANSQEDTSGETGSSNVYQTYHLGAAGRVTYRLQFPDSIATNTKFRYRVYGNTSWTSVAALSADTTIDATNNTTGYREITLRDNTTERVPGLAVQLLIIQTFHSSGNSANESRKYSGYLNYQRH